MRVQALTLTGRALRQSARARHPYLLRAGLCAMLLMAAFSAEVTGRVTNLSGVVMVTWVFWVNFALISFLGVSVFSSTITEEREQMTLGLLRMAGFSPISIIFGKSLALFVESALLLSVQLPFTMLAVTLGGVSLESIMQGFGVLFGYLVFVYGIGIFASVVSSQVGRAARLATSLLLIYHLLPPFLVFVLGQGFLGGIFELPVEYSAYAALGRLLSIAVGGTSEVAATIYANAAVGSALLLVSWWLFSRYHADDAPSVPLRLGKGGSGRGRPPRSWQSAIAWKEFYFAAGGWRKMILRLVFYVGVGIISFATTNAPDEALGPICMTVGFSLGYLEAGVAASRLFQAEIRDRTLGTLVALPMSMRQIAVDKIAGAFVTIAPGLLVGGLGILLTGKNIGNVIEAVFTHPIIWYVILLVPFSLILTVAYSLRLPRAAFVVSLATIFMFNSFFGTVWGLIGLGDPDGAGVLGCIAVVVFGILLVRWVGMRLEMLASEE